MALARPNDAARLADAPFANLDGVLAHVLYGVLYGELYNGLRGSSFLPPVLKGILPQR